MSKAVVFTAYGGPEVLHTIDTEPPRPTHPGEIRVRVRAAGVQPFDCLFRRGDAHRWMPASFPQRLGNEFAGVVDAVGEGVATFATGDEVLGWAPLDAYAEHVVVPAGQVVAKPAGMPWAEAGVLSASGQTASTCLEQLGVGQGDTVLIHAAAGGVGTFAVQLARNLGADVVGTASRRNHDFLRSLGATPVAYGDGLVERVRAAAPGGVHAALDLSGTVEALHASVELLGGETSRIGTTAYQPTAGELGIRHLSTERSTARLGHLAELHAAGHLKVAIQRTYPLEEAAAAHRTIEIGHVRGKLVLVPGEGTP